MRLSVITVATTDQERACAFYEAVLETSATREGSGVIYFELEGSWLALYPRPDLAEYCGVDGAGQGFAGVTLSVNLDSAAAVDAACKRARDAGATVVREPGPVSWGGHIAWVADPVPGRLGPSPGPPGCLLKWAVRRACASGRAKFRADLGIWLPCAVRSSRRRP